MPTFNIKNIVLAVALALSVGYMAGYYAKGRFVKADQFEAVTEARSETANSIQESLKTSAATEQEVTASNQKVEVVRKAASTHLKQKERSNEATLRPGPVCGLDVWTVGLLNSARTGTSPDAASRSDAASQAPSGLGIADLIDNDFQVVEQYHELAARHNALVDYVESVIQKQADQ